MPGHQPDPGPQDRRGIHVTSDSSAKDTTPAESKLKLPATSISVPFRLVAEFRVEVENAAEFLEEPDLTPQERSLFLAIIDTPEALNRICRLAVVVDLARDLDSSRYFERRFMGPESEDIFDSVLPYLPSELREFWTGLRQLDCDTFESCMDRIFDPFRASLEKTEIIDMATGESIPLWTSSKIPAGSERGSLSF